MSVLKVSIKRKDPVDMAERIKSSMTLRALVNSIKEESKLELNSISDIACEFSVEIGTREELSKKLSELLSEDFEVIITGEDSEMLTAPENNSEDKTEEKAEEKTEDEPAEETEKAEQPKEEKHNKSEDKKENETLNAILKEIEELIGAENFKTKAAELVRIAPILRETKDKFQESKFLFAIDDGNGISNAVRLLGELLNALGLIPKSRASELPPIPYADSPNEFQMIKANYIQMMRDMNGIGVILVDISKCYGSLRKEGYREFFTDVLNSAPDALIVFRIPYLEESVRRDVEEVLADRYFLHTVPFVPMDMEELYTYASRVLNDFGYKFADDSMLSFSELVAKEKTDGRFYGFRTVKKIVRTLIYDAARLGKAESKIISPADQVPDDGLLSEMADISGEEQLKRLIGMDSVVKQIEEIVSFIEFAREDPKLRPSVHMRFVGNPGTGKTTVARILGKILKERGILRTGVFFEYAGNDFVAEYVGHTAPKTAQMCRDAYGGVLFIDEAYELSPGKDGAKNGSFKQEALNTLITEMENHRDDMVVIMAGYEDEIDELMDHNPGLSQRMPYTVYFESYSREALCDIFLSMVSKKFLYDEEFSTRVKDYFNNLSNNIYYSPRFSNARYVRNLYERTISKAVMRANLNKERVATLTTTDFEKAVEELESTAVNSYGKDGSGAVMFHEERAKIKFADVCGQEEAKEQLGEMVDYLKHPEKYTKIGARVPKGALLYGPPGTGKTMLAKAVAGEAGVPVFTIAGSDLIGTYVGEAAEKVKQLFEKARKLSPSIIFIDEIDAIGTSRELGNSSTALLQLLTEMDGFDDTKTVIMLAATNRPEMLDPALRRPGRFDREVPVELPDLVGRETLLGYYLNKTVHDEGIDLHKIALSTTGFSGAELQNIVNEAAHRALRQGRTSVSQEDLSECVEVVAVGNVKKNRIMSDKEKRIVCYHEIGHALLIALQTHTAPVQKITVVPRTGGALGYVMHGETEEKSLSTKTEMINQIAVSVAGRAAEEVHFGEVTTGASNDIQKATALARALVATYGMTDELDMVCFDTSSGGYLGGSRKSNCSDEMAYLIDQKVIEIVREQHKLALKLLRENEALLDELAAYIYEKESITGEEFMEIFNRHFK